MKAISLLIFALIVAAASAYPTTTPRFLWMPDGDGRLHFVDLEETEVVPAFNPVKDVNLYVYTRKNPSSAQYIRIEDDHIAANFDPNAQTRFVSHGWNSAAKSMDHIKQAYMADSSVSYNVVLVDWSGPAGGLYTSAKTNSRKVGEYLAQVIAYLQEKTGLRSENVHLVGHSLGAHLSGVAGNRLGGSVARITGLDPAAPLFGTEALANRLDESDAVFVQVIHSCGGVLGWDSPMGTVDFYPNRGRPIQPGCGIDLGGACSHSRSHQFFAESITTNTGFVSSECSSWEDFTAGRCDISQRAMMGEKVSQSVVGTFYLKTSNSSPYALG